jgi:predicted phage-related endonuclease
MTYQEIKQKIRDLELHNRDLKKEIDGYLRQQLDATANLTARFNLISENEKEVEALKDELLGREANNCVC